MVLAETFIELLGNAGHWEFEIFGMIIFDGLLGAVTFPFVKRWIKKHDERKHAHEHCDDVHPSTISVPVEIINGIQYVKVDDLMISEVK